MNMTKDITVNKIPVRTWNHLAMNDADVSGVNISGKAEAKVAFEGVTAAGSGVLKDKYDDIKTSAGEELSELFAVSGIKPDIYAFDNRDENAYVKIGFDKGENAGNAHLLGIEAKEGSVITVYVDHSEDEDMSLFQTKLYAAKGSLIRFVQIFHGPDKTVLIDDIGGVCEDSAKIELYQLFISGAEVYAGCKACLAGNDAAFDAGIAYRLAGNQKLDMNYHAVFEGKRGSCDIQAGGALRDKSYKLFRGTIDFVNGCAGSVGAENESVLLIDDTVVNKTIPLILCAEEDVQGAHGASLGRPDEELLFYMQSRGLDRQEALRVLEKAKLDRVIGLMPHAAMREYASCLITEKENEYE